MPAGYDCKSVDELTNKQAKAIPGLRRDYPADFEPKVDRTNNIFMCFNYMMNFGKLKFCMTKGADAIRPPSQSVLDPHVSHPTLTPKISSRKACDLRLFHRDLRDLRGG